jgi:hypothetical protein
MATKHFCGFLKERGRPHDKTKKTDHKKPDFVRNMVDRNEQYTLYSVKDLKSGALRCYQMVNNRTGATRVLYDTPLSKAREMIIPTNAQELKNFLRQLSKAGSEENSQDKSTVAPEISAPASPVSSAIKQKDIPPPAQRTLIQSSHTHDLYRTSGETVNGFHSFHIVHRDSGRTRVFYGSEAEAFKMLANPSQAFFPER